MARSPSPKTLTTLALAAGAMTLAYAWQHRTPPYSFAGRVVLITGGSRGLGLALARRLADEGAQLILLARDWEELLRAQQDLMERGAQPMIVQCDVRSKAEVQFAVERVQSEFRRIDVLINCAGIIAVGPLSHLTDEDYGDALRTHFWGPRHTSEAVLPMMRAQREGRIVNIASIGGKLAVPHMGSYSASKAALVGLSEAMRVELAPEHIAVTTVCPSVMRVGSHLNAFFKGHHAEEFRWFAILSALPVFSTEADAAARQIIEGCRRGDAQVLIPSAMEAVLLLKQLFPNLTASALALVARLLPAPHPGSGDELKIGWNARNASTPAALTRLNDQATEDLNGLRGHATAGDVAPAETSQ